MKGHLSSRIIAILIAIALMLPTAVFALDETDASGFEETEQEQLTEIPVTTEEKPEGAEEDAEITYSEPGFLQNLTIEEDPTGTVEISWDEYSGASYYEVSSDKVNGGIAEKTVFCTHAISGLKPATEYVFVIAAFDDNGDVVANGAISITTVAYRITFNETSYRTLRNKAIKPKKFKINLTKMIKEKNNGYSVVQGGCTDGTYAYYLMVSTKTQKGRVLKVRMKDNKVVARSNVLNTWHGNGMTYDSKRNKMVVIAREHRKQEITVIDAKTLRITRQENVKYDYYRNAGSDSLSVSDQQQGLAAIAYVRKYDCYIVLERVHNNLLIFDPNTFQAIGIVYTKIKDKYPGTFQAMDADEKYVYLLLSYYNKEGRIQPYNIILALDWNSENLLPVVNASKSKDLPYVEKMWRCNNDGSGRPDAVIRLNTKYEAENIYHTTDKNGKEHFYLSEYYGKPVYKTVRKRVKINGKWRRKKVKKLKYIKRDNYVYDLGII